MYVGQIAKMTGWGEDYILRRLPLARGLQYQALALIQAGVRLVKTEAAQERDLKAIAREISEELKEVEMFNE